MAGDTSHQAVSQGQRGIHGHRLDQYGMIVVGGVTELAHIGFGEF